jgi:hypothetical protein
MTSMPLSTLSPPRSNAGMFSHSGEYRCVAVTAWLKAYGVWRARKGAASLYLISASHQLVNGGCTLLADKSIDKQRPSEGQ